MTRSAAVPAMLAVALFTAGCAAGSSSGDTVTPSASSPSTATTGGSPSAAASAKGDVVEVSVTLKDGDVDPPPHRVEVGVGSEVRLLVTSDVDDELHVHGYDVEGEVVAGKQAQLEFVADQTGIFEVETHEGGLQLVQLEVR